MFNNNPSFVPLATRMRPRRLTEFVGQRHLTDPGKPLDRVVHERHVHSMIFWGPPGTGKTTLAEIIAASMDAHIERLSAVLAGVKDIREVVKRAKLAQEVDNKATVLFVDEVHRFNKAQQDAFLPHVEDGTIIFIGATTENPSFELNNALLSRARVYVLKALTDADLLDVINAALTDTERGYGARQFSISDDIKKQIIQFADGDARQCLNTLEVLTDFAVEQEGVETIPESALKDVLATGLRRFDKYGEAFYDQISALHKSVRGSDPDAALYWLCRMLDGGCDPLYVARRVVRMASEDIGNADPRALDIALKAWDTYERLGSPEGELTIAQAVVYMACAAKSNAVYTAYHQAMHVAKQSGSLEVPMYLRNAPTKLMKDLGYHKGYRYAHDEPDAFAAGVNYFPEGVCADYFYKPVERGLEIQISEKLKRLRQLNKQNREVVDV